MPLTILAWEQRLHLDQLSNHAPGRPNVNLLVIVRRTKNEFWRPVVPRTDVRDRGIIVIHALGGTEIAQLELVAVLIDENVLWLDISMDYALAVQVAETSQQLPREHLHCDHWDVHVRDCICA